jgi:hypothetical protein
VLDLRAKLLNAGLVTDDQVKKAEAEKTNAAAKESPQQAQARLWEARIKALIVAPKSERYDAIRTWVSKTRLDSAKGIPSESAARHHFPRADGRISWLTLEPAIQEKIKSGEAGIVAFMSHNGLTHAVVPRDVATDIGRLFEEWVRALADPDQKPT